MASNIEDFYTNAFNLYNTPYEEEFLPNSIFSTFYEKFLCHHLQIAAEGKINDLVVSIVIPCSVTNEVIFSTEEVFLSKIQAINPNLAWDSSLHELDDCSKIYSLMLYRIF